MKDFQLQAATASNIIRRRNGTLVKSFHFYAPELEGFTIEIAALDKKGNLNIMVVKPPKNKYV